ncbi:DNA polymerase III subunit gamma/tau [Desulfosoma sp.]
MSYLVLARKWRPQTFEEVVGQPHVTRTLKNAVQSGRIAHAYLFTGARGVGKTSVARILAKALNCEKGVSPVPCNQCSNCVEIGQGKAVDVLEIDGASNRGIDSIRELRETVRYRPAKSAYKIYIIDEVHMLTPEAFNALLKTLEEPPAHVVFIFATTEPHKIPATILSRCQRYDFRRIATAEILDQLVRIARQEGAALSESVLYAVAREADGSMRDAQSLMEQLLALRGEDQEDAELLDLLGVVDRESVLQAAEAVIDADPAACLHVVERIYRRGIDGRRFCQRLCELFRDLLVISFRKEGSAEAAEIPGPEQERLRRMAARTTAENLFQCFQILVSAEEDIRRASLPRVTLEMLLLRLACLPRAEALEKILERLEKYDFSQEPARPRPSSPSPDSKKAVPEGSGAEGAGKIPKAAARDSARAMERGTGGWGTSLNDGGHPSGSVAVAPEVSSGEATAPPGDLAASVPRGDPSGEPMAELSVEEIVRDWESFCQWLNQTHPVVGAKLHQSAAKASSPNELTVEVLEIYEESVKNGDTEETLRTYLARYFDGKRPTCGISFRARKPAPKERARSQKESGHTTTAVLRHPVVQQALEILGGELVEIRPVRAAKPSKPRAGEADKTS